ncbi:uncharacterized protein [Watersipora subatra]|uniref:uncharacterized protein n=1 Tax=Watersipora subatra TaxID=2589382 RepID=UPI00355B08EF
MRVIIFLTFFSLIYTVYSQQKCANLPIGPTPSQKTWWVGSWQYFTSSVESISIKETGEYSGGNFDKATCEKVIIQKNHTSTSAFVWGFMVLSKPSGSSRCYGCVVINQRTINVMEFKEGACSSNSVAEAERSCAGIDNGGTFLQIFRDGTSLAVNCKNTFEGVFQFSYEQQSAEGICDNPDSRIFACQEPGSSYKGNQVFQQWFESCPGNAGSTQEYNLWFCLGSWTDPNDPHKKYAAISKSGEPLFEKRIRCLLTKDNQQLLNNQLRYTMSSTPSCKELADERDGPWRMVTTPALTPDQMDHLQPSCMLPQNFSGTWFTSSEYDSDVKINATHIHFNTRYTSFSSVDTFFSCQQTRDTRFLMKQVTQGRCEVDYVCFEFLPRHQNIIRFRMGKPYRDDNNEYSGPDGMLKIFRLACRWSAFTVSRTENLNYVYQTFILNPPAPVECPIGGIYNFTQTGVKQFKYQTKIRGVTERPRVGYQCDNVESEFKVCSFNPNTVFLDTERCATVDHVGRPIGEYDEPDNFLQCVGYWQENQQSYLVTHDTEDPVAPFRCWVYERLGWKDIRMSRALRAACGPSQTPRSSTDAEGASLQLELHENEREFDDCPQRFLDGRDPYMKATMVYILSAASTSTCSLALTFASVCLTLFHVQFTL